VQIVPAAPGWLLLGLLMGDDSDVNLPVDFVAQPILALRIVTERREDADARSDDELVRGLLGDDGLIDTVTA
jgi:hypothetical protein